MPTVLSLLVCVCTLHFLHTHTFPLARSGNFSSASAEIFTLAHQHSLFPAAMPQSFGPPQMGQRSGPSSLILSPSVARARRILAPGAPLLGLPRPPIGLRRHLAPAPNSRNVAVASALSYLPR